MALIHFDLRLSLYRSIWRARYTRTVIHALALLTVLILTSPLRAQAEPGHTLSLRSGLQLVLARDELLVPLSHSGVGVSLGLAYAQSTTHSSWNAHLDLGFTPMWNSYGHIAADLNHHLLLSYARSLPPARHWRLGAALLSDARINYFYKWDDAHAYWVNAQMLGLSLLYRAPQVRRTQLELAAHIGLLGIHQRPAAYRYHKQEAVNTMAYYLLEPYKQPQFAWLGTLQSIDIEITQRRPQRRWSFTQIVQLLRADRPLHATNISVAFLANREWQW